MLTAMAAFDQIIDGVNDKSALWNLDPAKSEGDGCKTS
jgi:hypothetical protein